ncbi:MAG: hypothetical protein KQI81_08770 [Deltaproteobacteria bacterium]|nr:hypothetical protein [Deltaproteobacteria bacterium]
MQKDTHGLNFRRQQSISVTTIKLTLVPLETSIYQNEWQGAVLQMDIEILAE